MNLRTEPVRILGWITAALALAAGVVTQVVATWDEATGWYGLALAVVVTVTTELQRSRVWSPASHDAEVSKAALRSSPGRSTWGN